MSFALKEHFGTNKKINWKKWLFYAVLVVPALLQFLVMYVFVNFDSIVMAFQTYDIDANKWNYAGLANFKALLSDLKRLPELKRAFSNSFTAWIVTTVVSIPLGLLFAFYIYKKGFLHDFFRVMLFLPSIVSASILTIIFKYYADTAIPTVINKIFGTNLFGLLSDINTQFSTLLIFNIFIGFGINVLMYTGAMKNLSEEVIEAAKIDGVNLFQEFLLIVLPQIVGTVSVFITTGIAGIFVNQLNLYSIYHAHADSRIYTIGYYLYKNIQTASSYASYPYNAALGLMISAIVIPSILIVRKLLKKIDPLEDS